MRWSAAISFAFVWFLVPTHSLALSPGQCFTNNNDSLGDQAVWTGTVRLVKVEATRNSGVLRLTVNPEICDPSSCGRTDTIDLRLASDSGGSSPDSRLMKQMVDMAYTRATRVRFRMVAGGVCSGVADEAEDDPIFTPIANPDAAISSLRT